MAPEKLENLFVKMSWAAEAFVYGSSLKSYCVGFFVVDPQVFPALCKKMGLECTIEEFCKNETVI